MRGATSAARGSTVVQPTHAAEVNPLPSPALPIDLRRGCMYTVHMKRITATEARRHWFRLLDEVAAGEVVVIERKGRRIVLRRENRSRSASKAVPDYGKLLRVPDAASADSWSWEWEGPESELRLVDDGDR